MKPSPTLGEEQNRKPGAGAPKELRGNKKTSHGHRRPLEVNRKTHARRNQTGHFHHDHIRLQPSSPKPSKNLRELLVTASQASESLRPEEILSKHHHNRTSTSTSNRPAAADHRRSHRDKTLCYHSSTTENPRDP